MKSVTCICFVLAVGLASCSSTEFEIKESEVPPNVLTAFKTKYPTAQVKKWQAEKDDGKFVFEVDFVDNGKEKEVHISPDGSSISQEE